MNNLLIMLKISLILSMQLFVMCVNYPEAPDDNFVLKEEKQSNLFQQKKGFLIQYHNAKGNIAPNQALIAIIQSENEKIRYRDKKYINNLKKSVITKSYIYEGKYNGENRDSNFSFSEMLACWNLNSDDDELWQQMFFCFIDMSDGELGFLSDAWLLWSLNSDMVSLNNFKKIVEYRPSCFISLLSDEKVRGKMMRRVLINLK